VKHAEEKQQMNRRDFIKATSAATLTAAALNARGAEAGKPAPITRQAPVVGSENVTGRTARGTRAKVYFTRTISAESLMRSTTACRSPSTARWA
jgi:hypothetical protein